MSDQPTPSLKELLEQCHFLERATKIEESMYQLQWGSAMIIVGVKGRALVIISPLFKGLPEGKEGEFCRHLLQLNSTMGGMVSFAIQPDGWVVLHGGREVKGMDVEEFGVLLRAVARSADQFDNILLDEYYSTATSEPAPFEEDEEAAAEATEDGGTAQAAAAESEEADSPSQDAGE